MKQAIVVGCSVNKFIGNMDHYLRENRRFKEVMITLSPLESFALSCMLTVTVLSKLGKASPRSAKK